MEKIIKAVSMLINNEQAICYFSIHFFNLFDHSTITYYAPTTAREA